MKKDQSNGNIELNRIEENADPMLIAGLSQPLTSNIDIPGQWAQFVSKQNEIPDQVGSASYGLCLNLGNGNQSEYLSGVEVSDLENLPGEFNHSQLPSHTYAVFEHEGHVSTIRQTIDACNKWIEKSDYELKRNATFFFERYGKNFNKKTGVGDIEIWLPINKN